MGRRFSAFTTSTGEPITLVKLDKSGGCVDRDDGFMQETREGAIKEYFFGDSKSTLSPHTQQMGFDDVTIYKINEGLWYTFLVSELRLTSRSKYNVIYAWWCRRRKARPIREA
jgi:polyribonucleotide 5'-hydroxyl-kinase